MWIDDAIFADAAKNLVLGHGYATASFDRLYPFARGLSAGPVIILPAAAMIAIFGNAYWVPGFTSVLLINGLLLAVYIQLKGILPDKAIRRQCAWLFLGCAMLITNHDTDFPPEKMHLWHALMGEVPSALLAIIAVLHVARHRFRSKHVFAGGLLAGLAGLCKLQAMIGGGILGCCLLLYYVQRRKDQKPVRLAGNLFLYGTGLFLPLLAFECVKLASFGSWHAYIQNAIGTSQAVHDMDGLSSLDAVFKKIFQLGEYVGISHLPPSDSVAFMIQIFVVLGSFFAALPVLCAYIYKQNRKVSVHDAMPLEWACNTLLACCLAHFIWWVFLCTVLRPRYALQGLLYGIAALSLLASKKSLAKPVQGSSYLWGMIACVVLLRYDALAYYATGLRYNPGFAEQQQVLHLLSDLKARKPDTLVFACGYAFEMEYLLPGSMNFLPCERLQDSAFTGRSRILLSYALAGDGKMITWKPDSFMPIWRENPSEARAFCPKDDLYAARHYAVASCHAP